MDSDSYFEKLGEAKKQRDRIIQAQHPLYLELLEILHLTIDDYLSSKTISAQNWSPVLKAHLQKMLAEPRTVSKALFVICRLLESDPSLSSDLRDFIPKIRKNTLSESQSLSVNALEAYFYFKEPDFKQSLISALSRGHGDFTLFGLLGRIGTEEDVPILMRFSKNEVCGETEGMGGPWRFYYRDSAFETIEKILGKEFPKLSSSEIVEGRKCSYYDWSPIEQWYANKTTKQDEKFRLFGNK